MQGDNVHRTAKRKAKLRSDVIPGRSRSAPLGQHAVASPIATSLY